MAILVHVQLLAGPAAGQDTTGAVWGREVPVGVSPAACQDGPIAHVDGDEHELALVCGYGSLAQDHLARVYVVVDGVEGLTSLQAGQAEDLVGHDLSVAPREGLADLDVMHVGVKVCPIEPAEVGHYVGLPLRPVQLLECGLDLLAAPRRLVLGDERVALGEVLLLSLVQVHRETLVVLGHLLAQVATARVNDQVVCPVGRGIYLDEVVAAAERANGPPDALRVPEHPVALKLQEVEALLAALPYVLAGGHLVAGLIERLHVDVALAKVDRVHAAADVDAHDVGNHLVPYGHGGSYGAASTHVHVGHDAHLAAFRELGVAHGAHLLDGLVLYDCGEALRRCVASLYLKHSFSSFPLIVGKVCLTRACFATPLHGERRAHHTYRKQCHAAKAGDQPAFAAVPRRVDEAPSCYQKYGNQATNDAAAADTLQRGDGLHRVQGLPCVLARHGTGHNADKVVHKVHQHG